MRQATAGAGRPPGELHRLRRRSAVAAGSPPPARRGPPPGIAPRPPAGPRSWAGRPTKAAACTTSADAQGAAGDVGALSPGSSCGDSRCSLSRIISNCPRAARASSISSALRSPPCSAASIRARISGICCTPLVAGLYQFAGLSFLEGLVLLRIGQLLRRRALAWLQAAERRAARVAPRRAASA